MCVAWAVLPLFAQQSGSSVVRSTSREANVSIQQNSESKVFPGSGVYKHEVSEEEQNASIKEKENEAKAESGAGVKVKSASEPQTPVVQREEVKTNTGVAQPSTQDPIITTNSRKVITQAQFDAMSERGKKAIIESGEYTIVKDANSATK